MNKQIRNNEFSKKERLLFYDYMVFYERNIKGQFKKDQDLTKIDPDIVNAINKIIDNMSHGQKRKRTFIKNEMWYIKRLGEILSLLQHLRNAIAHAYIKKQSSLYYIEDYDKHHLTMWGNFDKNTLHGILNLFVQ